jgi:membrane-bound lytic murein transglycosylase B
MKTAHLTLIASLGLIAGHVAAQSTAAGDRFAPCLAGLRADAAAKGVPTASFDRLTKGLTPDMSVLELLDYQPEFRTPIWDYLAGLVDEERVADALAMRARNGPTPLAAAAERYQVDADTVSPSGASRATSGATSASGRCSPRSAPSPASGGGRPISAASS